MDRPGQEIDRIADLLAELNLRYHESISVLPLDEAAFAQTQGCSWRNVPREGRAV